MVMTTRRLAVLVALRWADPDIVFTHSDKYAEVFRGWRTSGYIPDFKLLP